MSSPPILPPIQAPDQLPERWQFYVQQNKSLNTMCTQIPIVPAGSERKREAGTDYRR